MTRRVEPMCLKVKKFSYYRFGFGLGHQTGEKILLADLVDNVSVVRHRYRHFLHHLDGVSAGTCSTQLTETRDLDKCVESRLLTASCG